MYGGCVLSPHGLFLDLNSVLTTEGNRRESSLQVWLREPFRVFFPKCFCPNHQRFARKISKISVTGGAAAPSPPQLVRLCSRTIYTSISPKCEPWLKQTPDVPPKRTKIVRLGIRRIIIWRLVHSEKISLTPSSAVLQFSSLTVSTNLHFRLAIGIKSRFIFSRYFSTYTENTREVGTSTRKPR